MDCVLWLRWLRLSTTRNYISVLNQIVKHKMYY